MTNVMENILFLLKYIWNFGNKAIIENAKHYGIWKRMVCKNTVPVVVDVWGSGKPTICYCNWIYM